ncbi:MAG: cysteine desulfurase family protein [Clostridia bacterium]|nr:cysteine desulfurase family protein [Clostridia bacterium]
MEAYLDNSATTKPCAGAKKKINEALDSLWGNPSSLHDVGLSAEILLGDARKAVSSLLSCKESELYFTSGGTESNNIALFGAAHAMKKRGKKLVVSSVEHPSVSRVFDELENEGFEVVHLPVDRFGVVSKEVLENVVDENTVLVSMMAVNNELGSVEPIEELSKIVKQKHSPALIHVDAVQAFGKIPLNVKKLGVDLMSVSAHKIHGVKGAGALFVKDGVHLAPHVFGGGQEKNVRPGTEPLPAIAAFYGAAEEVNIKKSLPVVTALRDGFVTELSKIDGVVINSGENALPYIVNISIPGRPSEAVLNFLSSKRIFVSSGSACAKGHRSPTLTAAGLETELINSSLRISLSRFTTKEELDFCLEGIESAIKAIRKK